MKISVFNHQKDLRISKKSVILAVESVLHFQKKEADEVAIHFVSQKKLAEMHALFFDDPSHTDCISFPLDTPRDLNAPSSDTSPLIFLGEVFISPKTALDFVALKNNCPYEETTLYVVHGLMHLLGFDDIEKKDRLKMRALEKKHMKHLLSTGRLLKP